MSTLEAVIEETDGSGPPEEINIIGDLLTRTDTLEEALQLRPHLNDLLAKGKFLLRKWRSSSKGLLDTIPEDLREKEPILELKSHDSCPKALGVHWDTDHDQLYVSVPDL